MIITYDYLKQFNSVVESEEWRDYPYDDRVQISSWGNVRTKNYFVSYYNKKGTPVTRMQHSRYSQLKSDFAGYLTCGCSLVNTCYVHRLVAETFIPCPGSEDEYQVDHIDFNTSNSYVKNLQWLTQQDNIAKSRDNICKSNRKLNGISIVELKSNTYYECVVDLAKTFMGGTVNMHVGNIRSGMKQYDGYIPQYDIIVVPSDIASSVDVYNREIQGLRKVAAGVYSHRPAIYCNTIDRWFPSIPVAARELGLSVQMLYTAIHDCYGLYKKHNLQFCRRSWDDVPDGDILRMKSYIVDGCISRKGNGADHRVNRC